MSCLGNDGDFQSFFKKKKKKKKKKHTHTHSHTYTQKVVHQWFGNSVTVAWWSGLYLKEGFARLLEYVFIESRFPEWDFWKHFQMEIYGSVLERDEDFETTHPIERPINVPDEIYSNVDIICYAKVGSFLFI